MSTGAHRDRLVALNNVSVSFDEDQLVLREINFTLFRGESVLILGPSGGGKSTLALVLAGLIPRIVEANISGEVFLANEAAVPGGVGYVFQDPEAQFCMLQVNDEVAFGLENISLPRDQMEPRVRGSLERFGLHVDGSTITSTLSGGMKQKLALACACAMNPSFYLLDEPTANLDPTSTQLVFDEIKKLIESGQTVVVIEHKFQSILPLFDRVVLLDADGRLYRTGSPDQLMIEETDWLIAQGVILPERKAASHGSRVQAAPIFDGDCHPDESLLSVSEGELRYAKKTVWNHLNFSVSRGEWVAVLGENGAGKSSLLHVLAGLTKLSSGDVILGGQPLRRLPRREVASRIAFVFQNPEHQFIYERVIDEICNRLVGDGEPDADALDLLADFGLSGYGEASPFALSQGQKRRLSVACMLRKPHDVYMLDEPTFGQDARTQQAIMDRLDELHDRGATIVMTTHDMDLVSRYATRVLVLVDGRLYLDGTVDQLLADETLLRAAHLIGPWMDKIFPLSKVVNSQ